MRPTTMTNSMRHSYPTNVKEFASHISSISSSITATHRMRYYCCLLVLLSITTITTISAYSMAVVLPSRTTAVSNRSGVRRTTILHFSTPTNPSNSNNNIIEDDEDAKIFAALASSSSSSSSMSPLVEEEEMKITNTDGTYTGSVDWDAEWKEVMKKEKKVGPSAFLPNSKNRPGSDYYKSEAEIAAIRAANKVTKKATKLVSNVASTTSSLTDWNTIKNDWKIWIGVLAVLSFGIAFITAVPQSDPIASTDSYFI